MLHAMIMAGGGGTRFWPRSRERRPKQFLTFSGDRTLLQGTVDRIEAQVPVERTWIVTASRHREEAMTQLPQLLPDHIVGEPMGRDTAACIGVGAALIARQDPDAIMVVMPADHVIEPAQEFRRAVHAAEQIVLEYPQALVTFGVPPTYPAVGYGYIQRDEKLTQRQGVDVWKVHAFREKPSIDKAEEFVASGNFYWNSGIFVWKAATILQELRTHKPALAAAVERITAAWKTPQRDEVFRKEFETIEKVSIDYAVMEKAKTVLVLQAPFQWDDVGSWLALERRNPQDADGNTIQASHVGIHTRDCVIVSDANHLIATIGVSNLLIIQDGNATLVADRREEASVKHIVDKLKQLKMEKYL